MKKSKLLILSPCLAIAALAPIVSCNKASNAAEEVANAIFGPLDAKATKITKSSILEELASIDESEQSNELIYDLFCVCNKNDNMYDRYTNTTVSLVSNITKCQIHTANDKVYATFLGYVSFVFTKDDTFNNRKYKANDYIMYTYDFKNIEITMNTDQSSFIYKAEDSASLGFIKVRWEDGSKEALYDLGDKIATSDFTSYKAPESKKWPTTGHNWTK